MKLKQKPKYYYKINAIFYSLLAIVLFIMAFFFKDMRESIYSLYAAIFVSLCALYWIYKAIKIRRIR